MKRWIFLILAIIIISIFGIIKSCQKDKREVINIYTDREIENFIGKLAKKYENINKEVAIKINSLNSIEDYDIIVTNEDSKIKDNKKKYEVKDFFEDFSIFTIFTPSECSHKFSSGFSGETARIFK